MPVDVRAYEACVAYVRTKEIQHLVGSLHFVANRAFLGGEIAKKRDSGRVAPEKVGGGFTGWCVAVEV